MAARRSEQLLYLVYLARVIQIEAVQCYREAVTDDYTLPFFSGGCRPGRYGDFLWSLDAPEALPWGPVASAMNPVSLPMQLAWNAAVAAFKEFIAAIVNGELIASGMPPATGVRRDLEPAEWTRSDLILDVINGDLIDGRYGNPVRWSNITLRAATKRSSATAKRGPSLVDWDLLMTYGVLLREAGCLPSKHASLTAKLKALAQLLFRVDADEADLRRLTHDIYAGRRKRRKRKRER
jgi:hypothetical protein